jgi:hypothetical protein
MEVPKYSNFDILVDGDTRSLSMTSPAPDLKKWRFLLYMPQFYIDGKNLELHAFLVQVQSLKDLKPLPGIELGDIDLELAYNHVDNGRRAPCLRYYI